MVEQTTKEKQAELIPAGKITNETVESTGAERSESRWNLPLVGQQAESSLL